MFKPNWPNSARGTSSQTCKRVRFFSCFVLRPAPSMHYRGFVLISHARSLQPMTKQRTHVWHNCSSCDTPSYHPPPQDAQSFHSDKEWLASEAHTRTQQQPILGILARRSPCTATQSTPSVRLVFTVALPCTQCAQAPQHTPEHGNICRSWQRIASTTMDPTLDPTSQAILDSQSGPFAGRAFITMPTSPELVFQPCHFRALLLRRLRLPLHFSPARCSCRQPLGTQSSLP